MRKFTSLLILLAAGGCLQLAACDHPSAPGSSKGDSPSTGESPEGQQESVSAEGPRAGRKERPQRPALEE